jgi:hypothetical protein
VVIATPSQHLLVKINSVRVELVNSKHIDLIIFDLAIMLDMFFFCNFDIYICARAHSKIYKYILRLCNLHCALSIND